MVRKFKIERIRNKVRVKRSYVADPLWTLTIDDDDCQAINEWVNETNCGRRVAYDMWQLKNKEAVTLFILRWGS